MPGPQLKQAIPFSKTIKEYFPESKNDLGRLFSDQSVQSLFLHSGYVDFVINGPGDHCFPQLIDALENNKPFELIKNLIYKSGDQIIKTRKEDLIEQDTLPDLPYDKLTEFYPMEKYLGKTYLGQ